MKYAILLIGVFLAFVLGYLIEPLLRDTLIAFEQQAKSESVEPPSIEPPVAELPVVESPVIEPPVAEPRTAEPSSAVPPAIEPSTIEESVAPEAAEAVEAEAESVAPTDDEIRRIMSDSLEQAEIQHFTLSQVTAWKEFGEEEIDGELYHFGLIDYVEETSLGERTIEAKALIRNRKVDKWIWTRSEMRIE